MTPEIWITLAAANFAAYLAPGQNMALVGAATARSGLPGGLSAVGGILMAEFVWTAAALGLTLTAREIDGNVMLALQVSGGTYLVWSGWKVLNSPPSPEVAVLGASGGCVRNASMGLWVGLANPLALVFFVSIFPSLVSAMAGETPFNLLAFCGTAVLVSSLAALAPYLAVSQVLVRAGQARRLNALSGGALLFVGLAAIAWTTL